MAPWCDFVMASYIAFGHDKSYNVAVALQRWVWTNDYQGYFTRFCAGGILVAIPVTLLFLCLVVLLPVPCLVNGIYLMLFLAFFLTMGFSLLTRLFWSYFRKIFIKEGADLH